MSEEKVIKATETEQISEAEATEENQAQGDELDAKANDLNEENSKINNDKTEGDSEDADKGECLDEHIEPTASSEDENQKFMRLMADFQNYKKRTEKEKTEIYQYANQALILELLPIIDNFERALEHRGEDAKFSEGMDMIFKQMMDVLTKAGLEEIKAENEIFDPNLHNGVMTDDDNSKESGQITMVLQKGYTLKGKVIRPAMVRVNK